MIFSCHLLFVMFYKYNFESEMDKTVNYLNQHQKVCLAYIKTYLEKYWGELLEQELFL